MEGLAALPLVVMVVGLAVAAWLWCRGGRDLGAEPQADLPDTRLALLLACLSWVLGSLAVAAFVDVRSVVGQVAAGSLVHVTVALLVLRFALPRGRPRVSIARRVASGVVGGVAAYGVVALIALFLALAYTRAGIAIPSQRVVDELRSATGFERVVLVQCAVVLAPFSEEIFYRGVVLPVFARWMPARRALVAQAAVFGVAHVWSNPVAWPLALPLAVVGWGCGALYLRTGSLLAAVFLHATFNALQIALLFATA